MVPGDELLSASGRSNGARFVSAMPADEEDEEADELRHDEPAGRSSCSATMSVSESDWPISTTPSTASASETSYETSCAHVRIEPSSEYFDSHAQPPTMNP